MLRVSGPTSRRLAAMSAVVLCVLAWNLVSWGFLRPPDLDPTNARLSLSDVERSIAALYSAPEITGSDLAEMLGRSDVVLFDVRERNEFETSHLPGSVHILPDTTAAGFVAEHGDRLRNRGIVFYCSVGARSARMVRRVQNMIVPLRPAAVYNLRGGLFRWFVEGRPIENANGPATEIHPYDDAWRGMLQRTLDARG